MVCTFVFYDHVTHNMKSFIDHLLNTTQVIENISA